MFAPGDILETGGTYCHVRHSRRTANGGVATEGQKGLEVLKQRQVTGQTLPQCRELRTPQCAQIHSKKNQLTCFFREGAPVEGDPTASHHPACRQPLVRGGRLSGLPLQCGGFSCILPHQDSCGVSQVCWSATRHRIFSTTSGTLLSSCPAHLLSLRAITY